MSFDKHNASYKDDAWKNYTMEELGMWVALLTKRATHRSDHMKASKDLYDAKNYLKMMEAQIEFAADSVFENLVGS